MVAFLITCAAAAALALLLEQVGLLRDRRRYPPPGRMIPVRKSHLHIVVTPNTAGCSKQAVVLEAGIAGTLLGWSFVQAALAEFSCVCSYDRAGLGWSPSAARPRTVENMVADLAELLESAAVQQPYVLVGHSFGGLLVRAFAYRYPERVAGLVLVDPVSSKFWAQPNGMSRKALARGVHLSRRGAWLARFGMVRGVLSILARGGRHLPKLVGRTAAGQGSSMIERLIGEVRLLPAETMPQIRAHWSSARCFRAMADYLEALPRAAEESLAFNPIRRDMPVTILSAATATAAELDEREQWASASDYGRHIRVPDCGHWIQVRRPDVVIEAVRAMVELVTQRVNVL